MKHIHHIIPKHMGGTDDPNNLVKLSIEEHAEAHKKLYEQYGKKEDFIAWKGLSASINKEEILFEKSRLGGRKNIKPKTEEHKRKIAESIRNKPRKQHSKETKCKIAESMKGHSNSKNHSSKEYRKKQSEAMKLSWQRKKNNSV